MDKKAVILMGSPRKTGNTKLLCDEFARGAADAGNEVETVVIRDKKIGYCLGCGACQRNGGMCVQKDDMQEIYEKLQEADAIVLASPVYYYTWSGLLKNVLDRTFALNNLLQNKAYYLISACAAPTEDYNETMLDTFRKYFGCFRAGGNREGGYVFGLGTNAPGDVKETPAMEQAYELGKTVSMAGELPSYVVVNVEKKKEVSAFLCESEKQAKDLLEQLQTFAMMSEGVKVELVHDLESTGYGGAKMTEIQEDLMTVVFMADF